MFMLCAALLAGFGGGVIAGLFLLSMGKENKIRVSRRRASYRTADRYEVFVNGKRYLVGSVNELPERDREIAKQHSLATIENERAFLGHDREVISVRPNVSPEWHPADGEEDTIDAFPRTHRSIDFTEEVGRSVHRVVSRLEDSLAEDERQKAIIAGLAQKVENQQAKFKSGGVRRYSSGELRSVPEIRKRDATTPVNSRLPK